MLQLHRLSKYINILRTRYLFHFLLFYIWLIHFFLPFSYLQEAVQVKGLRDDTTCIVVDIHPPEKPDPPKPHTKKQVKRVLKSMFRKKSSESSSQTGKEEYLEPEMVEELFEEWSALLSERSVLAVLYLVLLFNAPVKN